MTREERISTIADLLHFAVKCHASREPYTKAAEAIIDEIDRGRDTVIGNCAEPFFDCVEQGECLMDKLAKAEKERDELREEVERLTADLEATNRQFAEVKGQLEKYKLAWEHREKEIDRAAGILWPHKRGE